MAREAGLTRQKECLTQITECKILSFEEGFLCCLAKKLYVCILVTIIFPEMEQPLEKERKWAFWLYMLIYFSFDSVAKLIIRKCFAIPENSFRLHLLVFPIGLSLAIGAYYALRHHSWKSKVWAMWAAIFIWLLVYILYALRLIF